MPIEVELPDGAIAEFPDGTPPEVMRRAVGEYVMRLGVESGERRAVEGAQAREMEPRTFAGAMGAMATGEAEGLPATGAAGLHGAMAVAPAVALPAAAGLSGPAGAAARWVVANPVKTGAAAGALPGLVKSDLPRAARGAGYGAGAAVMGGSHLGRLIRKAFPRAFQAAPAPPISPPAGASSTGMTPGPVTIPNVRMQVGSAPAAPVAPAAPAAGPPPVALAGPATGSVPMGAGQQLTAQEVDLIRQLRMVAQSSGENKIRVVQAAQQVWPDNWREMVKLIMAPRTTMPGRVR